jgi:hypothetical protein
VVASPDSDRKIKTICGYEIQNQIDSRAMLRTTHPNVDDCCHQARHKDPDNPLPGAPTVRSVLQRVVTFRYLEF